MKEFPYIKGFDDRGIGALNNNRKKDVLLYMGDDVNLVGETVSLRNKTNYHQPTIYLLTFPGNGPT